MTEIDRIKNGYWWYTPAGIPLPGFLLEILVTHDDKDRFNAWLRKFGGRQARAAFYLEAQYRRTGSATREEVDRWCIQAQGAAPDLSPAGRTIEREYEAALAAIERERKENHKQRFNASSAGQLQRALADKALPAGKAENLAAIRRTLKM